MNRPLHTKLLFPLAVISPLLLAGCGGDDATDLPQPPIQTSSPSGVSPEFNPVQSQLPLASDLLFSNASETDGTASTADTSPPVTTAINDLDGMSTVSPFIIKMSGSVDPASVFGPGSPNQNVFLIVADTSGGDGDALNPDNIVGIDVAATTALQANYIVDVQNIDNGANNLIRIVPIAPLPEKTKFLAFTLNTITDKNGVPTRAGAIYNILADPVKDALPAGCEPGDCENALQEAVRGWEQLAGGYLLAIDGLHAEDLATGLATGDIDITLSNTFTTTAPTTVMMAMAAPDAELIAQGVPDANVDALEGGMLLADIKPAPRASVIEDPDPFTPGTQPMVDLNDLTGTGAGVGKLYLGTLQLPYFLSAPQSAADGSFIQSMWRHDTTLMTALGEDVQDDDGTRNVTYRVPFAAKTTDVEVPLQVTLPDDNGAGAPYPTVIYVHGITSNRISVAALAHTLAAQGIATVAIDLPLHGISALDIAGTPALAGLSIDQNPTLATVFPNASERHFNFRRDPATGLAAPMNFATPTEDDGSGSLFINLTNLQNSRDNIRQGAMDLLNLNASLSTITFDIDGDGLDDDLFDETRLSLVGVSLGSIVGSVFATANETAIVNAGLTGRTTALNPLQGAVLNVPGGQISRLLENSVIIGPDILRGLAAKGVKQGTDSFEKFMYVAQATLDSADPVNYMASLSNLGLPVLFQEIVGGGDASMLGDTKTYTADKVIPNEAVNGVLNDSYPYPLAGTEPLITLFGAADASFGANDTNGGVAVRMEVGHHASLLRPSEDGITAATTGEGVATAELHTQVVSFVLDPANTAVGTYDATATLSCAFIQGVACPP